MRLFKWGGSILALVTGLGGYTSFKYDTTSPCAAAEKAVRDEMPKVLDELAETDNRFRALKVGGALLGGGTDAIVKGIATEMAAKEIEGRSGLECAYVVVRRELDGAGFRAELGERLAGDIAKRLPF